jgi:hypothetical protein
MCRRWHKHAMLDGEHADPDRPDYVTGGDWGIDERIIEGSAESPVVPTDPQILLFMRLDGDFEPDDDDEDTELTPADPDSRPVELPEEYRGAAPSECPVLMASGYEGPMHKPASLSAGMFAIRALPEFQRSSSVLPAPQRRRQEIHSDDVHRIRFPRGRTRQAIAA